MRIISGIYKSRKLITPIGKSVRPTSDRAKETLFNMLDSRYSFGGITCMDLFCGTGNLGLECISRGAAMCYFADTDTKLVMKNIEALNAGERSKVIKISAENFYDEYQELKPDMIFCDPPYAYNRHDFLLEKISGYKTLVILEHPENYKSEANTEKYIVFRKKIGTVNFTLFDFRKLK